MKAIVNEWEVALLFREGRYAGELRPGAHHFLNPFEKIEIRRLPKQHWVQVMAADALTADRFPVRLNVAALCEIVDGKAAFDADYATTAKLALTSAVAEAVVGQTLDELMAGREALAERLLPRLAVPGCAMRSAFVAGVTLPPEVRRLVTDVEKAKREGQAALERARAEQASLRALANAARLLKGNPELMNLRLLQAVAGAPKPATLVLGADALSQIKPEPSAADA